VLTVIVPKSWIKIWIIGTRIALTDIALELAAVNAPIAYRSAATLTDEAPADVNAPIA
jgi:hypothetical protein